MNDVENTESKFKAAIEGTSKPKPKAKAKSKAKAKGKGKSDTKKATRKTGFEKVGIVDFIKKFFTKGGTKQNCLTAMKKEFKGRDEAGMYRTINCQLSSHLRKNYKVEKFESKKKGEKATWKITLKKSASKK